MLPPEFLRRLLRVSDRNVFLLFFAWSFIITASVIMITAPVTGVGDQIIIGGIILGVYSYGVYEIIRKNFGSTVVPSYRPKKR